MGFKCGIVGLPNVGKSTLFNALTNSGIDAENYPFCTIEPNVGVVPVPDTRLYEIANIANSKQVIPAHMEFVDIAGLVEGASKGEGLGNQFLAHIRETQAIAQVVRCFEDENIVHVSGRVNPLEDIDIINTELCLADQETVEKALQKVLKLSRSGNKEAKLQQEQLEQIAHHLNEGLPARTLDAIIEFDLPNLQLLTLKPVLYIANVEEDGINNNPWLDKLISLAEQEGSQVIAVCAAIESEIAELEEQDKMEFLNEIGLEEPGLSRIIRAGYELLGLQTYFTAGPKESRAWTIQKGCTAPKAAGVIHTDFERGFIRAEVTSYDEAVKWRLEGKDYIVQDGDIMLFRFNV